MPKNKNEMQQICMPYSSILVILFPKCHILNNTFPNTNTTIIKQLKYSKLSPVNNI
jgi:hypothetical protein